MNERQNLKRNDELLIAWNAIQANAIRYFIMQGFLDSETDPRIGGFGERFRSFMETEINILGKCKKNEEMDGMVDTITQKTFDEVLRGH